MKKILLGLGALTAVITPVATVVACGASVSNGDINKKLTIDLTGIKFVDKDKIAHLSEQYDQYHDMLVERLGSVTLTMVNNGNSYSYTAPKDPSKCDVPDGNWEHLVVGLETLTGKPGIADLILDE